MSKLQAVRRAYARGGRPAVVKATRKWLARAVYPGPLPAPAKRPTAKPAVPEPARAPALAETIDHQAALEWFGQRRAGYERLAEAVAPYVDPAGVVFDVGANVGYFTSIVGEQTGFSGTAHLFEPLPHLARLCRETVAGLPFRAEVHEFGLSDGEALVDLWVAGDGNLGWNTLVAARRNAGMVPVQIRVHRFDDTGITVQPSFVKIDVEGAEYRVLGGMLPALERWQPRPVLLVEIGWGHAGHPEWAQEMSVFRRVLDLGYRTVDIEGNPIELAEVSGTRDVLFLPEGR